LNPVKENFVNNEPVQAIVIIAAGFFFSFSQVVIGDVYSVLYQPGKGGAGHACLLSPKGQQKQSRNFIISDQQNHWLYI